MYSVKILHIIFITTLSAFTVISCNGNDSGASAPPAPIQDSETVSERPNVVVFFTDDQGFADLGVQDVVNDIRTPNLDALANGGARFTNGYVTAPQCTPSRAAMVTGQYQQRFGVDDNRFAPMPLSVVTLGQRFKALGYATGLVGKWHLEIASNSREWAADYFDWESIQDFKVEDVPFDERKKYFPNYRGYDDTYFGLHHSYWATFDLEAKSIPEQYIANSTFRVDAISDAAVAFVHKHKNRPFYLHVAHFAPHVPLAAAQKYLDRFPNDIPMRRKYALAMMSAIDDGVGRVVDALTQNNILDNTIIIFISDNGAPLGLDMTDAPIEENRELWNGSLNTPLLGEKGMLTEGGIKVPFLMYWPNQIPHSTIVEQPVLSIDTVYTALKEAGASEQILGELDGTDIMPALGGHTESLENRAIYWRFWQQKAVRVGQWKLLQLGATKKYLFKMDGMQNESVNLIDQYPEVVHELEERYKLWDDEMVRPTSTAQPNSQEQRWYDYYLPQ
ncbi:MAG: iduronate sulfatase [Kangiellaceae bacterium]|nr:iduronate sulfatase [Kangiellaceae bacterium]|tara:strand:- start:13 stop:1524 length:1512 start_codon:yes stop_codon:yes gene_type:complete